MRYGCRFERSRQMTVGKTFVSETISKHLYEIQVLRKQIKNARPKPVPLNWVWGMDLTGKVDTQGKLHMLLGIVEHGSRAALCLRALPNKSSWTLLGHLFLAIGQYGKPGHVRTDNESVFCSRLFRFALFTLGIRHQTTDLYCPWQNGRIERFFGTLKERLNLLSVASFEALNQALAEFRFYYNHVRPHQHLGGATPAEAWGGGDPGVGQFKQEYWFEAWDGLLQGYYLLR
jgi:transposase InsO family protein